MGHWRHFNSQVWLANCLATGPSALSSAHKKIEVKLTRNAVGPSGCSTEVSHGLPRLVPNMSLRHCPHFLEALKGMVRLHQWFVSLLTAGFTKNVLFKLDIVCPRLLRVWWAPKRCALQITLARNRVWVTWQADCWFQVCLGYCWNVDAYIAHGLQEERREPELTGKYNWRLRSNRKKTIETREMFPFALFCSVFAPLLRLDRIHKFHFQWIKWIKPVSNNLTVISYKRPHTRHLCLYEGCERCVAGQHNDLHQRKVLVRKPVHTTCGDLKNIDSVISSTGCFVVGQTCCRQWILHSRKYLRFPRALQVCMNFDCI